MTRVRVGTSGWNYTEWKGSFYPDTIKPAAMLPYYAERFGTVEVNATFYRMPTPNAVAGWAAAVPAGFTFVLKAPQQITLSVLAAALALVVSTGPDKASATAVAKDTYLALSKGNLGNFCAHLSEEFRAGSSPKQCAQQATLTAAFFGLPSGQVTGVFEMTDPGDNRERGAAVDAALLVKNSVLVVVKTVEGGDPVEWYFITQRDSDGVYRVVGIL